MKKKLLSTLLIALLLIVVAGGAFWLGRDWKAPPPAAEEGADQSEGATEVQTALIREGTITQTVQAYGAMQPKGGSSVVVSIPFDSRVLRVLTTVGAQVQPGAPVVEVGPTPDVQLQLQQAQDTLTAATRALAQVKQRFQEQLATNADMTAAEAAERSAHSQLESLKKRGVQTTKQVPAGVSGTVSQVNVQPGQVVPTGTGMITIAPSSEIEAIVGVEPSLAARLAPGEAIALHPVFGSQNSAEIMGKIRQIGEQVNTQSHLRDVSIIPPAESRLLPGAFVIADVPQETSTGLIVPRNAVTLPDGNPVVFTIADGKARKHSVTLGLTNGDEIEIQGKDLHAGDVVVTQGALELDDGTAVKVQESPATEPSNAATAASPATPATSPRAEAP
ncbi:MAG: efflux RND transporter periplasmic adaptor subunit [Phycisphaerae bacterium]